MSQWLLTIKNLVKVMYQEMLTHRIFCLPFKRRFTTLVKNAYWASPHRMNYEHLLQEGFPAPILCSRVPIPSPSWYPQRGCHYLSLPVSPMGGQGPP